MGPRATIQAGAIWRQSPDNGWGRGVMLGVGILLEEARMGTLYGVPPCASAVVL